MTNADWHKYKNGYMQKVWKLLHERSFKYLENPSDDVQKKVYFGDYKYTYKEILSKSFALARELEKYQTKEIFFNLKNCEIIIH